MTSLFVQKNLEDIVKNISISTKELEVMAEKLQLPLDQEVLEATRSTVESWTNGALRLAEKLFDPKHKDITPIVVVKSIK